jgi:hypothetical protein
MFSTVGIPKVLEALFNVWAVGVLRAMFGPEAVPQQSWEEQEEEDQEQEEEDDEKETESASVTV